MGHEASGFRCNDCGLAVWQTKHVLNNDLQQKLARKQEALVANREDREEA